MVSLSHKHFLTNFLNTLTVHFNRFPNPFNDITFFFEINNKLIPLMQQGCLVLSKKGISNSTL